MHGYIFNKNYLRDQTLGRLTPVYIKVCIYIQLYTLHYRPLLQWNTCPRGNVDITWRRRLLLFQNQFVCDTTIISNQSCFAILNTSFIRLFPLPEFVILQILVHKFVYYIYILAFNKFMAQNTNTLNTDSCTYTKYVTYMYRYETKLNQMELGEKTYRKRNCILTFIFNHVTPDFLF